MAKTVDSIILLQNPYKEEEDKTIIRITEIRNRYIC